MGVLPDLQLTLTPVFLFLLAFVPRLLAAKRISMTEDEVYALFGVFSFKHVAEFNFSSNTWSFLPHPPILMYLYGLSYVIYSFIKSILRYGPKLSLSLLYREGTRLASGRSALLAMRMPSIILGSLSCVITYVYTLDLFGDGRVAFLSALILAFIPRLIAQTSVAGLDGGITFFYILTFFLLFRAVKFESLMYLVLSGISLGLTFGSKETGFIAPLVVAPWFASLFFADNQLVLGVWNILLWFLIGLTVFYLCWPFLWESPVRTLLDRLTITTSAPAGATGFYRGTAALKPDFYLVNLMVTTPVYLMPLFIIGTLKTIFSANVEALLLYWVLIPIVSLSLPVAKYRDNARHLMFIFPAFSILTGLGVYEIAKYLTSVFPYLGLLALLPIVAVVGLLVFECSAIHPYYLDYYNQLVGGIRGAANKFFVGWWGEGLGEAVDYVDKHAMENSIVWIYGLKTTAIYHSKRINLEKSFKDEPIFSALVKSGVAPSVDRSLILNLRKGDLTFYFPHYHPGKHDGLELGQLVGNEISYIIIYRRFIYPGQVDPGNNKFITTMLKQFEPVYTVNAKGVELCWVFDVKSLLQAERTRAIIDTCR